ncbi:sulfotransferase family protein [Streptomyces sp. NPDC057743]|uniref:sulfotransferase family protein n=1 Tax=Streptomyces sp. NPDC057743 TaxID=3346236 RepID=UPI00367AED1D
MTQRLGVLVLGMHRSGTSAVTRAVNLLGVPTCVPSDLTPAGLGNQRGHWESRSLVQFNNALLNALGRSSWCPPPLDAWAGGPHLPDLPPERARRLLERLHPTPQWVWKDPRTSLTLPFWLAALHDLPLALVLCVRDPLEVAASLRRRDGTPWKVALCMWERYLRHALAAAAGRPVLVTRYETLLADPVKWARTAEGFLAPLGARITWRPELPEELRAFVDPALHHETTPPDEAPPTPGQRALYAALLRHEGPTERFRPPELPPEAPGTEGTLCRHAARPRRRTGGRR